MDTLKNTLLMVARGLVAFTKRLGSWWLTDFRARSGRGKLVLGCGSLFVLCFGLSFCFVIIDNSLRAVGILPTITPSPMATAEFAATADFTAEPISTEGSPPSLNSTSTATKTTTPTKTAVPATSTIRPTRAASSTPRATNTPRSTNTPRPTNTAVPPTLAPLPTWTLALPTNTAVFTAVPVVTDTPFPSPVPTQELPTDVPPVGPPAGVPDFCTCSGDNLNCPNFGNQPTAQACFNYCIAQGAGDVYGLDNDSDGIACESLPGG